MLKGESSQPCSAKMGPKRNGSQRTGTPAAAAASSIRAAERYEYVLPNSNQNSRLAALTTLPASSRRSPDQEAGDSLLVPLQADSWTFGQEGVPVLDPGRFLQNGAGSVQVLQTMRCRADGQKVSAYLREDVAREWETRGLS